MPKDSTCPLCACPSHASPQTWEVRCTVCGELRWPYQVDAPSPGWICSRCRAVSPVTRARRQEGGRRRLATLAARGTQTSQDRQGAAFAAPTVVEAGRVG
jgi:hypothetical protein